MVKFSASIGNDRAHNKRTIEPLIVEARNQWDIGHWSIQN
jgi:hypothetical protein